MLRARRGAQERSPAVPEPGRLRGEAGVPPLLRCRRRMPDDGTPIEDVEVDEGLLRRQRASRPSQAVPARSSAERRASSAAACASASRACSTSTSTAPVFRTYFEALGIRSRTSCSRDATTEEMWVEGGKYGSIDPCYPSKVAQAHVHNLLFVHQHRQEAAAGTSSFPILTHVPSFVTDTMDNASCPIVAGAPDVMKAAFTKEVDFFAQRGIEYLDPALTVHRADAAWRSACSRPGARASGSPRTRTTSRARKAWKALERVRSGPAGEGARDPRDGRGREPRRRSWCSGGPYHSDPGLNHGIPEEFQVLGLPDPLASARSRRTGRTSTASSTRSSTGPDQERRSR